MTIEEILKLPFYNRRRELLKAYVKVVKEKFPEAKCRVSCANMDVWFPKTQKKNEKINLSGEWEGWTFFGWKDGWQNDDNRWRYTVSIYPPKTEVFMLRPIEVGFRSTHKQRITISKAILNHSACVVELPSDDRWMDLISIKRASNLLDALFANKKVAIVYDMTEEEIEAYFRQMSTTDDDMEPLLKKNMELKERNNELYKEQEKLLMGNLVPIFDKIHIVGEEGKYKIMLTLGDKIYSKPCEQADFMYFKLRNSTGYNYQEHRKPVIYLAKKYFCDILDDKSTTDEEPLFIYTTHESFKLVYNESITDINNNMDLLKVVLEESFKTGEFEKDSDILIQGRFIHNLKDWNLENREYQFRMIGHKERHIIAKEFNKHLSDWATNGNLLYLTVGVFLTVSEQPKEYPEEITNYQNLLERIVEFEHKRNRTPVCFMERIKNIELGKSNEWTKSRTILYFSLDVCKP